MSERDQTAEQKIAAFYRGVGWTTTDGVTEDARRFEDLRPAARAYVSKCRQRVQRYIPERGAYLLDMASGPIQYEEYLAYSQGFEKRYCVDLSEQALAAAREKIQDHGEFVCGNWLDVDLAPDFFDCAVSLHTIYHIDKDQQEQAVRKLLRVTKPGAPVIIVYTNPRPLVSLARGALRRLRLVQPPAKTKQGQRLYVHAHPLRWWRRFEDVADVTVAPWRSFSSRDQQTLIPGNRLGEKAFDVLFRLEDRFPAFFARNFQYPMIVLTKREASRG